MKRAVLACLLVLVLACGGVAFGQQVQIPREEALYMAGLQWGPPTSDNPFVGSPMTFVSNPRQHIWIYEPLFTYDGLLTGDYVPILGESYQWRDDLTLEVKLNPNAYFHDGEKVTADDVVYAYKFGQKYPVGYSSIWDWLEDVYKEDDHTVIFKMKADNPNKLMVEDGLGAVYIIPEHIWAKIEEDAGNNLEEIRKFDNKNPIGSGPYRVFYESPETIALERVDNYWGVVLHDGELPRPKYIVHPIFKSNDEGNLAFENGEVDLSQQFMPRIWECWENKKLPIGTWYKEVPYHVPATMPSLWFNVNKHPLDLPELRKAIAYCIDYAKISELAMSNYSPRVEASLIVPYGAQAKYFNKELVQQEGWEYNPEKAVEILEKELGAKKGNDGIYVLPDGTRLGPFKAECPYGWTDWNAALEIVAQSAKAIGIDIQTSFPDAPVAYDNRQTGNFDMTMWTPSEPSPAQPWLNFQIVLYSGGVPEYGKIAYRNFGRYKNERVDELIDLIPKTSDEAELQKLYDELDSIYRQDVPTIPLMYRPWVFYEYNETHWKGFPNADNPYAPAMPSLGAGIEILWHIEPVK